MTGKETCEMRTMCSDAVAKVQETEAVHTQDMQIIRAGQDFTADVILGSSDLDDPITASETDPGAHAAQWGVVDEAAVIAGGATAYQKDVLNQYQTFRAAVMRSACADCPLIDFNPGQ